MSQIQIRQDFSTYAPELKNIFEQLKAELETLFAKADFKIHSLKGRIKSSESLEQKVARPDRNYESLWQITDVIGFRFITYSEDVIERVARTIENAFDMDFVNSVNKLRSGDDQRFGYRSLHYVCFVPDSLLERTPELKRKLKFEIQIRTNLQHTWAEFEHELGYKVNNELPGHLRRRFSQIASLLEVADRELVAVHSEIKAYENELKTVDLGKSETIELDQLSLLLLLDRTEIWTLDQQVAKVLGKSLSHDNFYPDYLLRVLHAAGFKHVRTVLDEIPRVSPELDPFIESYFEFTQRHWNFGNAAVTEIKKGYGLLFLSHLALLKRENLLIDKLQTLTEFYEKIDYPNEPAKAQAAARELLAQLKLHRLPTDEQP